MADLFISYSRKDIAYARLLHKALKENELETWIDWQDIPPSTEWLQEVYSAIEEANTFIFILSSTSVLSEICVKEIDHARENNKRIIPIVIDDVEPKKVHPALAAINWIFSRTKDDLQPAIENLIAAIQTDYDWVKAHTRLQVRALEWERSDSDRSYLLKGTDLQQAENWLVEGAEKQPDATQLQTRYIQSSRQDASKQQRRLLVSVAAALVATIVLGVLAVINGQRAEQQRGIAEENAFGLATQVVVAEENARLARVRELLAVSQLPGTRFDTAMLLGVEGYNTFDNFQTRGNLNRLAQINPEIFKMLPSSYCPTISVAFSPDGKYLAVGNICGEVLLWKMDKDQLISIDPLHGSSLNLEFSADGKLLAANSGNDQIDIWDTNTWKIIKHISGFGGDITSIAISPDSEVIAFITSYSDTDNQIFIWDLQNNRLLGDPIKGLPGWRGNLAFSPDGKMLTIGYNRILILDMESGLTLRDWVPDDYSIITMALSPDGNTIATGSDAEYSAGVDLWDLRGVQLLNEPLGNYSGFVSALAFSPDGKTLAVGSFDNSISRWDLETLQPIGEPLFVHTGRVQDIAFSPDGQFLVSVSDDGSIIQWDFGTIGSFDLSIPDLEEMRVDGAFSPDGSLLAVTGEESRIRIWDIENGQFFGEPLIGHTGIPVEFAFTPDNSIFASMSEDGTTFLWDVANSQAIGEPFFGPSGTAEFSYNFEYSPFLFNPDGNLLVFGKFGPDSEINAWDFTNVDQVNKPFEPHFRYLTCLSFTPDGRRLASGFEGGVLIWDVDTGLSVGELQCDQGDWVRSLAFSPDGKILATVGGGTIKFWNAESKFPVGNSIPALSDRVEKIDFSPDGNLLASINRENSVVFWDVSNQKLLGSPLQFQSQIISSSFSRDGKSFLVFMEDGSLVTLDTDPEAWRNSICARVSRNFTQEEWALYFMGEAYRKTCEQWPGGE